MKRLIPRLIPSMFHRRLVLIGASFVVAAAGLAAQLGRLTLVEGDALRARAEARMRYTEWVPTTRGRILDRNGRVLAHDRACYNVSMDYAMVAEQWAREQATALARRRDRAAWAKMGEAEREELVSRVLPVYEAHVVEAWGRLSRDTGVPLGEIADERRAVVGSVEAMAEHLRGIWERQFREQHARTGRAMEPDDERRLARIQTRPIAEQEQAHVVIRAIPDETAFALLRLVDQKVLLDPWGTGDSGDAVEVALIPGLVVEDAGTREYPFETVVVDIDQGSLPLPLRAEGRRSVVATGLLADVLGWMGTPTADVIERREERRKADPALAARTMAAGLNGDVDLGAYRAGDLAGVRGIEAFCEDDLRGLRGMRIVRHDTGESSQTPAAPGRDVTLTIDAMLQARVQAIMSPDLGLARVQAWHGNHAVATGAALNGAAVVLDVDTGEVLAMVSTPGVTQDERRRAEGRVLERVRTEPGYDPSIDPDALLRYNRAVGVAYAPGSVAKVVMVLEAVRQGVYSLSERIACTGHLIESRSDMLRCWIYKRYLTTHSVTMGHDLSAEDALTASCNIFFYTLGRRLGADGINEAYERFGVGQAYDLGVGPAAGGHTLAQNTSESIMMGIGQGRVAWTPMHAADMLATVARGGVRLEPTLVRGRGEGEAHPLGYDPAAVRAVIDGLDGAVHDATHGTGEHITFTIDASGRAGDGSGTREVREAIFNVPGVRIVGKTGTATAQSIELIGSDGRPVLDDAGNIERVTPDHSWYVALVGPQGGAGGGRLRYAIAVMMENAGSGGKVSGPICNQIVWALVEEGYLPRVEAAAP
ncbi:MAG: penicillin-binding transpeptidase domain-containing protein [Phycisphaerales bacterium]